MKSGDLHPTKPKPGLPGAPRDRVNGNPEELFTTVTQRHKRRSGHRDIGTSVLRWRLQNVWQTALAALREIFDESAYERFLLRTRAARSVSSYRAFMRERETAITRKPRCC